MPVMDRVRHAAILPSAMTARSGPKQCSQNIQKNRCRTTVAEPIGETLAELPFTGDQAVCLGHDLQAAWSFSLSRCPLLPLVGATHEKARVVRDGNVITAGGVTSGIDFGLTVATEIAGETTAQTIQLGIEYDPAPPFDSGHPDRAPAAIKSALLSGRYEEARSAFRGGIDKATRL